MFATLCTALVLGLLIVAILIVNTIVKAETKIADAIESGDERE